MGTYKAPDGEIKRRGRMEREREGAVLVTGIARHLLRGTVHSDAAEEEE